MPITTTLRAIRKHNPCKDGWEKLLASLGKTKADDEPLAMTSIVESNGLDDALWCLRALGPEHHKLIVSLLCDFAERSLKFVPEGELRPAECLRITRLWIDGKATTEEVQNVCVRADGYAADAAAAARAARVAADASYATAAYAASYPAIYASYAAADAERAWQTERFIEVMTTN